MKLSNKRVAEIVVGEGDDDGLERLLHSRTPIATTPPRTFYLNERHELSREAKAPGGRVPQYVGIDWSAKAQRLHSSLSRVQRTIQRSPDPLRDRHYFLLAKPTSELKKSSKDRRRADKGVVVERPDYGEKDSRTFRRLGVDLLQVVEDGSAVVHARPERMEQLVATASELVNVGAREQARWATIDAFDVIPSVLRLDEQWLQTVSRDSVVDAVIELQPLLSRLDAEELLRSIVLTLHNDRRQGIIGGGTDFSGRQWVRGNLTPESIRFIARGFYSIQALHSPLRSVSRS